MCAGLGISCFVFPEDRLCATLGRVLIVRSFFFTKEDGVWLHQGELVIQYKSFSKPAPTSRAAGLWA